MKTKIFITCLAALALVACSPDEYSGADPNGVPQVNDYADSPALERLYEDYLVNVTRGVHGQNGVAGTYRYKGKWESLDHVLVSQEMRDKLDSAFVHAPLFLLEEDKTYGGYLPRRTYKGMKYQRGYSDHLPLVARFRF